MPTANAPKATKKIIPKLTIPVIPVCRLRQKPISIKIQIERTILEILNALINFAFNANSATGIHSIIKMNKINNVKKIIFDINGFSLPYKDLFFNSWSKVKLDFFELYEKTEIHNIDERKINSIKVSEITKMNGIK